MYATVTDSESARPQARLPTLATRNRIECVQSLRCLAATLVVLYHTDLQIFRLSDGTHAQSAGFGAAGTDLLFIVSGFILVYICHGKQVGFGEFMFRRLARIAPLYWLLTLCMLGAFLTLPSLFQSTKFDPAHFLASLAFLPYPHPVIGSEKPFLVPGWALNYIAFFYLLFGLFLFLPSARRIVAVGLILGTLVALRWLFFHASPILDFYGAPIILDFVMGMLVAWIYLARHSLQPVAIAAALAVSAALLGAGFLHGTASGDDRVLFWGVADAALLVAVLFIERQWGWSNPRAVALLGNASFSTYLSNLFSLALVTRAVHRVGLFPILGVGGTRMVLVVSALVVGVLIYLFVELPLYSFVLLNARTLLDGARRFVRPQARPLG
jgi:exopolysaccharide production protein ExoZ